MQNLASLGCRKAPECALNSQMQGRLSVSIRPGSHFEHCEFDLHYCFLMDTSDLVASFVRWFDASQTCSWIYHVLIGLLISLK